MRSVSFAILTCVAGLLALPPPAGAQGAPKSPGGPYFRVDGAAGVDVLPLKDTRSRFQISGTIARVRLTQVYENSGARPIEAVYVFPASTRAAIHGMRMRIGERVLEAKIDRKDAARKTYRDAKNDGRQAGLLEQERPNVFQMRVANIRPGDRVEVEVDYTELMSPEDGIYELVIPSVVGPRYTGESAQPESWTANPHLPEGSAAPYRWDVSGKIRAGLPVAALDSPSHEVSPRFFDAHAVGIEVDDERGGDRDFVLRYRLGGAGIETGLLLFPGEKEQFFLLTVAPPKRVAPSHVVPREYVFVVDVSGSMSGFPIDTAKKLLRQLVRGLGPQDRFNVVLFAGGSNVMSPQSVPPTGEHLAQAEHVLDRLRGGGGTNLLAALKRALQLPRDDERSTSFVVVTDGYVSVEREALELISDRLGDANLFTFGIGTSVNRHLIESLARAGMGAPFVVLGPGEAATKAQSFLRYIEQPVLTNIQVSFDGFDVRDVEPIHSPDLFSSRPVTVFGKYEGQPAGRITVRGRSGSGEFLETVTVRAEQASDDLAGLAHLWARHRVTRLSDLDATGGPPRYTEQITKLGLQYSLLTAHTSFIAVSNERVVHDGTPPTTVRQPVPLPKGVSNQAITYGSTLGSKSGESYGVGGLGVRGTGGGGGGYGVGRGGGKLSGIGRRSTQPSVRMRNGSAQISGSLDKSAISRVIRRHRRQLQYVYERQLNKDPGLGGKLVFQMTIGADGRVTKATIKSSTLNNPTLIRELLKVLRRMRFPKPRGGGTVVISYPLIFSPK